MSTVDRINVRAQGIHSSARAEKKLDRALGLTPSDAVNCGACGGRVYFDVDEIGRMVDRCGDCGTARVISPPAVRPEGEGYSMQYQKSSRRKSRDLPESNDPAVLLLRETRAARAAAGPSPAMLDAKRMYDENTERLRASRNRGGRPKKIVAVDRVHRGPVVILDDDDDPGTPPPAAPAAPVPPPLPPPSGPDMRKQFSPRSCLFCHTDFVPTGTTQRYCTTEHRDQDKLTPSKKPAAKAAVETPRKRVDTGYRAEPPRGENGGGRYANAIAGIELEIEELDARRVKLVAAVDHLRSLEADAA